MTRETEKALRAFADAILEAERARRRAADTVRADGRLCEPATTIDPDLVARLGFAADAAAHLAELAGGTAVILAAAGGTMGAVWTRALVEAMNAEREALSPCPCAACVGRRAERDEVTAAVKAIVENTR